MTWGPERLKVFVLNYFNNWKIRSLYIALLWQLTGGSVSLGVFIVHFSSFWKFRKLHSALLWQLIGEETVWECVLWFNLWVESMGEYIVQKYEKWQAEVSGWES